MTDSIPRYTSTELPPYSYVPGHAPHPVSDPKGHMYDQSHVEAAPLVPDAWRASTEYLYGIDLFNHGFYWEAHESWEALWHAVGRAGEIADFLKGLIKLAAACVKAREGNPRGVRRHAARAKQLLASQSQMDSCGLHLVRLLKLVDTLGHDAESFRQPRPQMRLDIVLRLNGI